MVEGMKAKKKRKARAKMSEEERAERQRERQRRWYAAHRKKTAEEVSASRRAVGKKGMASRWGGTVEATVSRRIYAADDEKLKAIAPRTADAVRRLLEGQNGVS